MLYADGLPIIKSETLSIVLGKVMRDTVRYLHLEHLPTNIDRYSREPYIYSLGTIFNPSAPTTLHRLPLPLILSQIYRINRYVGWTPVKYSGYDLSVRATIVRHLIGYYLTTC